VSYYHVTFALNVLVHVIYSASGCSTDIKQAQTPDIPQKVNIFLNLDTRNYMKTINSLSTLVIITIIITIIIIIIMWVFTGTLLCL